MVTPMMSQITFEGLIDEVTGIKAGVVPWVPKGGSWKLGLLLCALPWLPSKADGAACVAGCGAPVSLAEAFSLYVLF